jgi:hypothetical protein
LKTQRKVFARALSNQGFFLPPSIFQTQAPIPPSYSPVQQPPWQYLIHHPTVDLESLQKRNLASNIWTSSDDDSNANVLDGNNNELFKASLKVPAEASNNLKPASKFRASQGSQASVLPPMLKNGNLCGVVLRTETSGATGEKNFLANSLAGVELAKLPVPML